MPDRMIASTSEKGNISPYIEWNAACRRAALAYKKHRTVVVYPWTIDCPACGRVCHEATDGRLRYCLGCKA